MSGAIKSACAALIFLLAVAPSTAQTAAPAKMPPGAQESIEKGVAAAKLPDYLLAIRYFEDARKLAPSAPIIFLNLGLAESRIPGRELRAIAWFAAYLAAYPGAPNAAAVKEQITALDARNRNNVSRLIRSVQDAASQLPSDNLNGALDQVAGFWMDTGDMAEALKVADLIKDTDYRGTAEVHAVRVQLRDGDVSAAQKTSERIQHPQHKASALFYIAEMKREAGDLAGAKATYASALIVAEGIDAESVYAGTDKDTVKESIAIGLAKSGDITSALKAVELLHDFAQRSRAQRAIAVIQEDAGDRAGGRKTRAMARASADLIQEEGLKRYLFQDIIEEQAKADAKKTPGQKAASSAPPAYGVSDWLEELDGRLNAGPFLDLAGYLKSLPPSDNGPEIFEALRKTTNTLVAAQFGIHYMLKHPAAR